MVIEYIAALGKITRSRSNLGPHMHDIHSLSAYGHALMPVNLDLSYEQNSSTALLMILESQCL